MNTVPIKEIKAIKIGFVQSLFGKKRESGRVNLPETL
jgi:hypothetical protein